MDETELAARLSVPTRPIDPTAWDDIYVVGDVHGCSAELDALLAELSITETDLVVFVGDLVRKGPNSHDVIETVRSHENLVSVRGNNEQKLLDGEDTLSDVTDEQSAWLAELPIAATLPDTVIVHGGVNAGKPLAAHTPRELLTMRGTPHDAPDDRPYWFETRTTDPRVCFGHTVLEEPLHTPWAVGLDTGCVHGRTLSYYDWRADRVGSVSVSTEYVHRPPADVLSPTPPEPVRADQS